MPVDRQIHNNYPEGVLSQKNDRLLADQLSTIYQRDNLALSSRALSADTTLTNKDSFVDVLTSGGDVTITLPYANTWRSRTAILFIRANGANDVIIALQGSDILDGTSTVNSEETRMFISDGVGRWIGVANSGLLYNSSTYTPTLTFATPGDLAVGYSVQQGFWTLIGNRCFVDCVITTSSFTHTTASGDLRISLPFTSANTANRFGIGELIWMGITKAGYTDISASAGVNVNYMNFVAGGSGVGNLTVTAADMPTGGTLQFIISINYTIAL